MARPPLEACYPLVVFDAIRVKIRDEGLRKEEKSSSESEKSARVRPRRIGEVASRTNRQSEKREKAHFRVEGVLIDRSEVETDDCSTKLLPPGIDALTLRIVVS